MDVWRLRGSHVVSPAPAAEMCPGPADEARCRHGDGENGPPGQVRLRRVSGTGRDGEERRDGASRRFGSPDTRVPCVIHPLLPLRPRMPASLNSWAYAANNTLSRRVPLTRGIEVETDTTGRFPAQWAPTNSRPAPVEAVERIATSWKRPAHPSGQQGRQGEPRDVGEVAVVERLGRVGRSGGSAVPSPWYDRSSRRPVPRTACSRWSRWDRAGPAAPCGPRPPAPSPRRRPRRSVIAGTEFPRSRSTVTEPSAGGLPTMSRFSGPVGPVPRRVQRLGIRRGSPQPLLLAGERRDRIVEGSGTVARRRAISMIAATPLALSSAPGARAVASPGSSMRQS
ncbi:hypothetical protein SVIOM74S_03070 [Streptomyces violarus]